jgi:hypothetical protein
MKRREFLKKSIGVAAGLAVAGLVPIGLAPPVSSAASIGVGFADGSDKTSMWVVSWGKDVIESFEIVDSSMAAELAERCRQDEAELFSGLAPRYS